MRPFYSYEVVKPIVVTSGSTAPWFGQPGGGIQYMLHTSVENLVRDVFYGGCHNVGV